MSKKHQEPLIKTLITTNIKKLAIKILLVVFSFILVFFSVSTVEAGDYTNTNFILRDPVVTVSGGRSTAPSFEFFSATGQIAPGESTTTNFTYRAGFLYFEGAAATPAAGGGGGKYYGVTIVFSGKAYPQSPVILLKDAQIFATVLADGQANFKIETGNLSSGDYLFSLYSKDYNNKASRLISFLVKDVSGITEINDILIPPTILKDKKEVKKGDTINFFGQSIPNAEVTIKGLNGEFSVKVTSDKDGKYSYNLDTSSLDFGEYQAISKVSFGKSTAESAYVSFIVGDRTIFEKPIVCPIKADFNNDCAVNLVDFSILIYWFDKPSVPLKIDLNSDGKADLVDFSIMAYWWTG